MKLIEPGKGHRLKMGKAQDILRTSDEGGAAKLPFDLNLDYSRRNPEEMSSLEVTALSRFRPELREWARSRVSDQTKLFFDLVPENYAIESPRGVISFRWLNLAADAVQIYPELRKYMVHVMNEEDDLKKRFSNLVFKRIEQSKRAIDTQHPPFELNLARYIRPALELCPGQRSTILSWLKQNQLHLSLEMYLNGEVEEQMSEFSLDPQTGWVQGFAAAKTLFPDLAERINTFFSPYWPQIRQMVKGKAPIEPDYLSALVTLWAEKTWIDEKGEFHIEFRPRVEFSASTPLPERPNI